MDINNKLAQAIATLAKARATIQERSLTKSVSDFIALKKEKDDFFNACYTADKKQLKRLVFPANLTSIRRWNLFSDCISLEYLFINKNLTVHKGPLFSNVPKTCKIETDKNIQEILAMKNELGLRGCMVTCIDGITTL